VVAAVEWQTVEFGQYVSISQACHVQRRVWHHTTQSQAWIQERTQAIEARRLQSHDQQQDKCAAHCSQGKRSPN
jgi:hypothetical protein